MPQRTFQENDEIYEAFSCKAEEELLYSLQYETRRTVQYAHISFFFLFIFVATLNMQNLGKSLYTLYLY